MRITYVLPDPAEAITCEAAAYIRAMASVMAAAGHEVNLIADSGPTPDPPVRFVPLVPSAPEVWHLDPFHEGADRVFRTLIEDRDVDVAEIPATAAAAFTVVRSRRLLGTPRPPVVVRIAAGAPPGPPVDFGRMMLASAQRYVFQHADALSVPAGPLPVPTGLLSAVARRRVVSWATPWPWTAPPPPAPDIVEPVRTVCFLGEFSEPGGYARFVAAAARIANHQPGTAFRAYGHDTPTDPVGRSFRDHITRRWPDLVTFADPPSITELSALFAAPAIWVIPARHLVDLAMLHGVAVITGHARSGALQAELADPAELADCVLAICGRPGRLRELTAGAPELAWHQVAPSAVRERAERCYDGIGRRPAAGSSRTRRSVSVVIPLYNQGRYVRAAVESAVASTGVDVEVVVVDDGSTDPHTIEVLDGLQDVVKVRQPNRGLAAARNAGLAASRNRYVMPLDADDLISPDYLSKAIIAIERNPELAYVCSYCRNFGLFGGVYAAFGNVLSLMPFLHTDGRCAALFDRRAVEQVDGYDENLSAYEDWDLQIRLGKAGFDSDVIPEPLFHYRRHERSMVFQFSNERRVELIQQLMRKHADLLEGQGLDLALVLVHLWRTGFEASESTRFRNNASRR